MEDTNNNTNEKKVPEFDYNGKDVDSSKAKAKPSPFKGEKPPKQVEAFLKSLSDMAEKQGIDLSFLEVEAVTGVSGVDSLKGSGFFGLKESDNKKRSFSVIEKMLEKKIEEVEKEAEEFIKNGKVSYPLGSMFSVVALSLVIPMMVYAGIEVTLIDWLAYSTLLAVVSFISMFYISKKMHNAQLQAASAEKSWATASKLNSKSLAIMDKAREELKLLHTAGKRAVELADERKKENEALVESNKNLADTLEKIKSANEVVKAKKSKKTTK